MEQTINTSDERDKECICPLKDLLCKLDRINFVSYDRIDKESGNCDAGVLAHDVLKVFPNMVHIRDEFLPNIQQNAEYTLMANDVVSIRITNTFPIRKKDSILCIITNTERTQTFPATVMNATEISIEVKKWANYKPTDKLSIHGTMVDDYHAVDIGQIGVLGAACAKELYHMVKCQAETIAALQAANAATSSQLALLNGTCATLQKQIDDINARLS
jgi:hypothetical protein